MTKRMFSKLLFSVAVLLFGILSVRTIMADSSDMTTAENGYPPPIDSPEPPVTFPPPPTPVGPSEAAQEALKHIAKRYGIPTDALRIEADYPTNYATLKRKFQVVTLIDTRPTGGIYKVLVELKNGKVEEDLAALLNAEANAYHAQFGKLQQALHQRLQGLKDSDTLPVAVWLVAQSQQTVADGEAATIAALAAKYPEVKEAVAQWKKPMEVDDPELAKQIEAEYRVLMQDIARARVMPLVIELGQQNFAVTVQAGMPAFTAILPKHKIIELSRRADILMIYLIDQRVEPELDTAVPNTFAPKVWARGIDGSGVTVGILEIGNVDPSNTFIHHAGISRPSFYGVFTHTTQVASIVASFNNTYRGMAYNANILSAGHSDSLSDTVDALQWAIGQGVRIINMSEGATPADNNIGWLDQAFDYWARQDLRLIVKSSGNTGGSVTSPGKGWNVMTVGAYSDFNTLEWNDDQMWYDSAYINPISLNGDREKPEVVAVGGDVTALGIGNAIIPSESGTSFAAPQVAGLAALLIDRNQGLDVWPEALRAIIMASATHNIEGPSIVVQGQGDLKDGAGAINADLADQTAQLRGVASLPCPISCWWGDAINNTGFPVGTEITRTFNVTTTSFVRVAISWWANADNPTNNYSFSRLDTDLDLRIKRPDGQWVTEATSVSQDNNYEIVEFGVTQIGQYQIVIRKFRADETSNYLGTAVVMQPLLSKGYLPLILKDYPPTPTPTITPSPTRTFTPTLTRTPTRTPTPCPYPPSDPRCQ